MAAVPKSYPFSDGCPILDRDALVSGSIHDAHIALPDPRASSESRSTIISSQ